MSIKKSVVSFSIFILSFICCCNAYAQLTVGGPEDSRCSTGCPFGQTQNPTTCTCSCLTSCTPPKVQNADCSCGCTEICLAPLVQNPSTCDCNCQTSCTPQQVQYQDCNCGCLTSCPPGQTQDPTTCACTCSATPACTAPKTKTMPGCACSCPTLCPTGQTQNANCSCSCSITCLAGQIQDPTTCACCNPNVSSGLVNFEEFPEYANIAIEPYRSQILQKYGIQFDAITGGNLAIAEVVNEGDSEPSFEAWWSIKCPGNPKRNRVCNGGSVGRRVLSMTNATNTRTAELSLTLIEPVQSISFDIIDMDGNETWTVTATDRDGKSLPSQTVSSSGYGGSSGNNGATNFQVKTLGREIESVRIHGTKSIKIFGFGFDNFKTGITPCK